MKTLLVATVTSFLLAGTAWAMPQDNPVPMTTSIDTQTAREARFAEQLSGCQMVGQFTDVNSKRPPQKDSYTISKVTKIQGDKWRFDAKIEYGKKSVTVPVTIDVKWAGDTPMIQCTKLWVPMLGTYSARIVVYGDQYAGMWSGKNHGGHMFGKIVPNKKSITKGGEGWPRFRGPEGSGVARNANPPTEWSEKKNILWKVSTPGLGISTPIILKDRIYLTTAIPTDKDGKAPTRQGSGGRRGRGFGRGRAGSTKVHEFAVVCLNAKDGKVVWNKTVKEAVPHERGHATASQASNSPVTDGEHIYAHFGSRGLHCLDLEGNVKWSKEFGTMWTAASFGEGSSPAIHGDTIVINWDHEGESFITALNKKTGKKIWREDRNERTSWTTPIIVDVGGKPQVIVCAQRASRVYDLKTGKLVWSCKGMTGNCIPTPIHVNGVAYLMSGFRGSSFQAIRLKGAKGDITEDIDQVLWEHGSGCSYTPSHLVYDGFVYFLRTNSGRLSCLDAKTGKIHYQGQSLRGLRTVYASPVGAAKRVYITGRGGTTKVLKLGKEFKELASNDLDDTFDASAALVGDRIYLRGRKSLYCIAESKPDKK